MQWNILMCTFLAMFLMIPSMNSYQNTDYDESGDRSSYLAYTAVCSHELVLNVSVGCGIGETSCLANYRPNCELPFMVVILDLAMSVFLAVMIICSVFVENKVSNQLDESIQSTQDYSLVVNDPDRDATDPDEWHDFFKQFGDVRYITGTNDIVA